MSDNFSTFEYVRKEHNFKAIPIAHNAKTPLTKNGLKDASDDPEQINSWNQSFNNPNWAFVFDDGSDYFAIDLDRHHPDKDGIKSFEDYLEEHGLDYPVTLTTQSPTGLHFYFRKPKELIIKSKVGILPGVDSRAPGSYLLVPPSSIGNKNYKWLDPDDPIADAPQAILDLVSGSHKPAVKSNGNIKVVTPGSRNAEIFKRCCALMRAGRSQEQVEEECQRINLEEYKPPLDPQEVSKVVNGAFQRYSSNNFNSTEIGNTKRMARMHGSILRYVYELEKWLLWDGNHWKTTNNTILHAKAKETIATLWDEAASCIDEDEQEKLYKHAHSSDNLRMVKAMCELLYSEPGIAISVRQLNSEKTKLPLANGTLDLETMEFSQPDPASLNTKISNIEYDPKAECFEWIKFLHTIMGDNADVMVPFLQRAIGYTLSGLTVEQYFYFLHGVGANGKSTFINILRYLLGDFGTQAAAHTFLEKRFSGNGASSDIARLEGFRLTAVSEVSEAQHFNEMLIKSLTGGDEITARKLYANETTFRPQLKLWVAANYKPGVSAMDEAMWRRTVFIPFDVTIPKENRDPKLEKKLVGELPGILNWAVAGFQEWQRKGLQIPQIVEQATQEYRAEADIVGTWIAEECVLAPTLKVRTTAVIQAYKEWCENNGCLPLGRTRFNEDLKRRGIIYKSAGQSYYYGISLCSILGSDKVQAIRKQAQLDNLIGMAEPTPDDIFGPDAKSAVA